MTDQKRPPTKALPSVEFLRACFDYDPANGELRWRTRPMEHFADLRICASWNTNYAGTIVGSITLPSGYRSIGIRKVSARPIERYFIHRIIWKMVTGEEPPKTLDHVDGNRLNNRWSNLRAANLSEQQWNQPRNKLNISGYKGVHRTQRGKWCAMIRIDGRKKNLGATFLTPEAAAAAYEAAARRIHGEFYCPP